MFNPEGSGVKTGVGALDDGFGILSDAIEYTIIFAKDAMNFDEAKI